MPITRLHSSSDLREKFRVYGRLDTFSSQAFEWLWDYLEQLEDSTGEPVEIDVIGLCCDYSEEDYDSIASYYSIDLPERDEDEDEEEYAESVRQTILDYLNDHRVVLGYDEDSVLYAAF